MDVSSLPKTVTRQRRHCDLNPGPSAPESSITVLPFRFELLACILSCRNKRILID